MYMYIKRWLCFDFICIKFELIYNMYIEQTSALNIHTVIRCRFESTSGFLFDTVPVCLGNSNPGRWIMQFLTQIHEICNLNKNICTSEYSKWKYINKFFSLQIGFNSSWLWCGLVFTLEL